MQKIISKTELFFQKKQTEKPLQKAMHEIPGILNELRAQKIEDPIKALARFVCGHRAIDLPANCENFLHICTKQDYCSLGEEKRILIAYLAVLHCERKANFLSKHDGTMYHLKAFSEEVASFLDTHQNPFDYMPTDLSLLRQKKDGSIHFGRHFSVSPQELEDLKPFRPHPSHTSKAQNRIGYANSHGFCGGLAIFFGRYYKKGDKEGFFQFLKNLDNEISGKEKDEIGSAEIGIGKDVYETWNATVEQTVESQYEDKELGKASHSYFACHYNQAVDQLAAYLTNRGNAGMDNALSSSVIPFDFLSGDIYHAVCFFVEKEQGGKTTKLTFYDPNTKEGPVVKWLDCQNTPLETIKKEISALLQSSDFLRTRKESVQSNFWCYPVDKKTSVPSLTIVEPQEEDLKSLTSEQLGSFLLLSIQYKNKKSIEKIVDFVSAENPIRVKNDCYLKSNLFTLAKDMPSAFIKLIKKSTILGLKLNDPDEEFSNNPILGAIFSCVDNDALMYSIFQTSDFHLDQVVKSGSDYLTYKEIIEHVLTTKPNSILGKLINANEIDRSFNRKIESNGVQEILSDLNDFHVFLSLSHQTLEKCFDSFSKFEMKSGSIEFKSKEVIYALLSNLKKRSEFDGKSKELMKKCMDSILASSIAMMMSRAYTGLDLLLQLLPVFDNHEFDQKLFGFIQLQSSGNNPEKDTKLLPFYSYFIKKKIDIGLERSQLFLQNEMALLKRENLISFFTAEKIDEMKLIADSPHLKNVAPEIRKDFLVTAIEKLFLYNVSQSSAWDRGLALALLESLLADFPEETAEWKASMKTREFPENAGAVIINKAIHLQRFLLIKKWALVS